jgi:hypothetical protein
VTFAQQRYFCATAIAIMVAVVLRAAAVAGGHCRLCVRGGRLARHS